MGSLSRLPRSHLLLFAFFALLVLFAGLAGIDHSCLDSADSTYIASADGIARGLMPYRDYLAAHPPLLFLLGAPLATGGSAVPFRVFSLLVAVLLAGAVWQLGSRLTGNRTVGLAAGILMLIAPLGIFFSKLFLNDSLVALLGVVMLLLLMPARLSGSGETAAPGSETGSARAPVVLAAIAAALGMLTKLTFLPLLFLALLFLSLYRRRRLWLFCAVALGGTAVAWLALEALSRGAFLADILWGQASKGYSFTNFYEGLGRIWQMDWMLLLPALAGLILFIKWKGRPAGHGDETASREGQSRPLQARGLQAGQLPRPEAFLLLGWLAAGLLPLATLPAEGHDTNLFQTAEPAICLLAAWVLVVPAARNRLLLFLAVAWAVIAIGAAAFKDWSFLNRSNSGYVDMAVALIDRTTPPENDILAPGCYALQAGRPVTEAFFDPFLWDEKLRRNDADATELFGRLEDKIAAQRVAAIVEEVDQPAYSVLRPGIAAGYVEIPLIGEDVPRENLWLPRNRS